MIFKALSKTGCLVLLSLVLLALAPGCSRSPDQAPDQTTDQNREQDQNQATASLEGRVEVIRLSGGDYGYPSPYAHYPRGPGGYKMCLIFDSLLERGEKGLIPWLAEDWQVSDRGKACIFTIRQGVVWHDGRPFTCEDVAFSLDYAARHPMTWSYVFGAIQNIEILPENKVKVTLREADATMLDLLGKTRILPKHIWEKVDTPKTFTGPNAVIGTGPYRLTGYSREHGTYRFEAFDRFWGPRPRVGRIEFLPVSEPILAYEKGEIDLVRLSPDLLPRYEKNPDHRIVKSPGFWGYRLLFNMAEKGPLQTKAVRQAFAHAIDREELVAKIARGAAIPGQAGILPPDHIMADPSVKEYKVNPQKAARLLESAGYPALDFDLLCSGREVRMAEIIKQRLGAVGVTLNIISVDGKTRDSRVRNRRFTLAIIGHGGWGGDPNYLYAHCTNSFSSSTSPLASGGTGTASPAFAALLKAQCLETDPEKRRRLIYQIQHLAAEEVPEIPLYYTTAYNLFRPDKYDGWLFMFDHHSLEHSKLSYLDWKGEI
ncbi:MAG: diguanylate phosphodiesterase [Desulfobacter sp.]|nr:MAG: diguanylate phosphodiesterase [Desulfobacter sp.]